jgi:hypothetical protein
MLPKLLPLNHFRSVDYFLYSSGDKFGEMV